MTYQSELISLITKESGECAVRDEPLGRVLAADDDDDDMKWLQDALFPSDYELSDVDNGEHKEGPEATEVPVGGEVVTRQDRPEQVRARGITRPVSLTKTQRKQHYLEGHANSPPGCPFYVRFRGLADRHERKQDDDDLQAGDDVEPADVPTISFDFDLVMQKDHGKSIPTLVARDHKSCYTHAFTCPSKSTKEEEYSEQIVRTCKVFVEMLGYKRMAMKGDQERAMRALQQRVQNAVNVEMVLTNSKRYFF